MPACGLLATVGQVDDVGRVRHDLESARAVETQDTIGQENRLEV